MTDLVDYEALVRTTAVRDIVSGENNRFILSNLRDEDCDTDELTVVAAGHHTTFHRRNYCPAGPSDAGWLGYFAGQNSLLHELNLIGFYDLDDMEPFFRGLEHNKSIMEVKFEQTNVLCGAFSPSINAFMKNNPSLVRIKVAGCVVGAEGWRRLSLAMGSFTGLKHFELDSNDDVSEQQLVNIITALSMHPSLENLSFMQMNVGQNACSAMATLCTNTATELRRLCLWGSNIDDERVETLLGGLSGSNALDDLVIPDISPITSRSYRALASILERPQTRLDALGLTHVDVDDDGAIILARALRNNRTLSRLVLNQVTTSQGWSAFSQALCNTSSSNSTFHSNHTLEYCFCGPPQGILPDESLPDDVRRYLELNRNRDKSEVAINKILMSHSQLVGPAITFCACARVSVILRLTVVFFAPFSF